MILGTAKINWWPLLIFQFGTLVTTSPYSYQHIFRKLPSSAVVIVDAQLVVVDANDIYFELTGYKRANIVGKTTNEIAESQLSEGVEAQATFHGMKKAFEHVIQDKTNESYDFVDSTHRVWHVDIHPILVSEDTDTLALMLCQVTDHTQLFNERRIHRSLLDHLNHVDNYRRLVDAVRAYGIFMVDGEGLVEHWSQGAAQMTKWSESEILGKHVYTFYADSDHRVIKEQMNVVPLTPSPSVAGSRDEEHFDHGTLQHTTFLKKDGTSFPADTTITPIFEKHEQIGHVFVVRDLTQTLEDQKELKKAYEEAAILKDEFTSRCSHDIRTPLNAISLAADAIYATSMSPEQTELVYLIKRSIKKMLVQVNEILDFGKLTVPGRRLSLHLEPTDLIQFFQVEIDDFKLIAPPAITIEFKYPTDQPLHYLIDRNKMSQITSNLISNALKFTKQGSVSVILSIESGTAGTTEEDTVTITFKDTGQGVTKEDLKRLFIPYSQIDGSNTQLNRGSGLGLSIVKMVTKGMGGHVYMTSEGLGKGSQVIVSMPLVPHNADLVTSVRPPLSRSATSTTMDVAAAGNGEQNILIAEDDDVNRTLLVRGLHRLGYNNIHEAKNGQEMIEMASPNHNYDLIISDIQMPLLSGTAATKLIRGYDTTTPIIALTADNTENIINQCNAVGMNRILLKPTRIKTLGKEIFELLKF